MKSPWLKLWITLAATSLVTLGLAALLLRSGAGIKPDRRVSFQFDVPVAPMPSASRASGP